MSTIKNPAKSRRTKIAWDDTFYVRAHEFSRAGMSRLSIGKALGIPERLWNSWLKTKPALQTAIKAGRSSKPAKNKRLETCHGAGETFLEYVYGQLPPDLARLWERILAIDEYADQGPPKGGKKSFRKQFRPDRIERLFQRTGIKRARQHLFIHAVVHTNFNMNEACRMVNISSQTVDHWRKTEPDFDRLYNQIGVWMKNFGEAALMKAMDRGEASCINFFNATKNADRGYTKPVQKLQVDSKQTSVITYVELDKILETLPLETRLKVLKQLEGQKEPKEVLAIEGTPDVGTD